MRTALLIFILYSVQLAAQDSTVFAAKKPVLLSSKKVPLDTFVQRIFLSDKTITEFRVIYGPGIKLLDEHNLILFKATQGIIDSLQTLEYKNTAIGEWDKIPYVLNKDTIKFIRQENPPSMNDPTKNIHVTHGYVGYLSGDTISMQITSSADNLADMPLRVEQDNFKLYKTSLLIRRKN